MLTVMLAVGIPLCYVAIGALSARYVYHQLRRTYIDGLLGRTGYAGPEYTVKRAYRRWQSSPEQTDAGAGAAGAFLFWPLVIPVWALLTWLTRPGKPSRLELQRRSEELERELGIGRER